jgi:SMODS and SLOG-associating 2TM effector domain 1
MEEGRIPFRVWIGVVGRCERPDHAGLREQVTETVRRLRGELPATDHTGVGWGVVSTLADEGHRMVARELLNDGGTVLRAVLEDTGQEHLEGSVGAESRAELRALLQRARSVSVVPPSAAGGADSSTVDEYVLDHSDALLVLSNGVEPEAGADPLSALAQYRAVPLFSVSASQGQEVAARPGRAWRGPFDDLDAYNRARIPARRLQEHTDGQRRSWEDAAVRTGSLSPELQLCVRWIVPYLGRADFLARRYQRYYLWFGTALFALSALATGAAAVQVLSPAQFEPFAWLEAFFMLVALAILALGRWRQVHRRWISCRALAERFRMGFFLCATGLEPDSPVAFQRLRLLAQGQDWTGRGFREVWAGRPPPGGPPASLQQLKRFLLSAWIDDQLDYYRRSARRQGRLERVFTWLVGAFFVCTLLLAAAHGLGSLLHRAAPLPAEWLIVFAVMLPAVAAATRGIQAQREYEANASRFRRIAQRLDAIRTRISTAADQRTLQAAVESAVVEMLEEHRDWFGMMQAHPFRLSELV